MHVSDGENPLVSDSQTWFRHLASRQEINNLIRLASEDASDLAQQEILGIVHATIYAADSFFRDEKIVATHPFFLAIFSSRFFSTTP
jgi:hypothetical protein